MESLRNTASLLFSLLLVGFMALEVVEACGAFTSEFSVMVFDFDSEESEEGQEEEREGPEEKKDKTLEDLAFVNGERLRLAAEGKALHEVPPPNEWEAMVAAKIWEPPEWV
ncbi:MAG: hypothetical protein L7S67_01415 [Flavobacteriales bacterium]|nr:hypothetical protein [Flavobacteriales bacterium]